MNNAEYLNKNLVLTLLFIFLTGCSTTKTVSTGNEFGGVEYQELTAWGKFCNSLGRGNDNSLRTDRYGVKRHWRLYGGKPHGTGGLPYSSSRPLAWKKYQDDPDHRQIHFWFK